jgi:secondary thiamine-phosphate synthase enzyme
MQGKPCGSRDVITPDGQQDTIMIKQVTFEVGPFPRGFHLVTGEVMRQLPEFPKEGMLNLFVQHTSCGLTINENCDPDVRHDLKGIMERLVPDGDPAYRHRDEGPTDMSAHAKSTLVGTSLNIPIINGHLALGIWQGIYLCEFREHGGPRRIVATIMA